MVKIKLEKMESVRDKKIQEKETNQEKDKAKVEKKKEKDKQHRRDKRHQVKGFAGFAGRIN